MASSSVFVFTIMVACAVCGAIPFQKSLPREQAIVGGPVLLSDSGSSVTVSCRDDGLVTLELTNPEAAGRTARIRIGPLEDPEKGNACWSGDDRKYQSLASAVTISTSATNACGRTLVEEINGVYYKWAVNIEEINMLNSGIEQLFPATFEARCAQKAAAVPPETGINLPVPLSEGSAEFPATPIAFQLTRVPSADNSRVWTLSLQPATAGALSGGLDYILTKLTATPTGDGANGADKPVFSFIDNCIANGFGTEVARATDRLTYTIKIRAFQFTGYSGIGVDFTAEVRLCAGATYCGPIVPPHLHNNHPTWSCGDAETLVTL